MKFTIKKLEFRQRPFNHFRQEAQVGARYYTTQPDPVDGWEARVQVGEFRDSDPIAGGLASEELAQLECQRDLVELLLPYLEPVPPDTN